MWIERNHPHWGIAPTSNIHGINHEIERRIIICHKGIIKCIYIDLIKMGQRQTVLITLSTWGLVISMEVRFLCFIISNQMSDWEWKLKSNVEFWTIVYLNVFQIKQIKFHFFCSIFVPKKKKKTFWNSSGFFRFKDFMLSDPILSLLCIFSHC